jgi:hypothetical protein
VAAWIGLAPMAAGSRDQQVDADSSGHDHDQDPSII